MPYTRTDDKKYYESLKKQIAKLKKKRNAVMDTIRKGFPLNVIYWAVNEDGSYEVLAGLRDGERVALEPLKAAALPPAAK